MTEKPKKKNGAPKGSGSKYTIELADKIVAQVSDGIPLRQVAREANISWVTIYSWMETHKGFFERIARARDLGQEAILEDALRIADTPLVGVVNTYKDGALVETKEEDMLGHRKLQIETRLKLLAKWNPKKYGDRITHAGDPAAPLALVLNGSDVDG